MNNESKPQEVESSATPPTDKKISNRLKISVIVNIVLVAIIAVAGASMFVLNLSNTDPNFCATCHIMQKNVTSYLTSNNLDNIHNQAGVQCKECHSDYDVLAEITSGVNFIVGNYSVNADGELEKREYEDTVCTQCHISLDHVAELTSYLDKNPHNSHLGDLECKTCHISHGEQIDYCAQCHDHGEQELIGADDEEG